MSKVESTSTVQGNLIAQSFIGIQGDNPGAQITSIKLDGKNYLEWSQLALMYISGRGKLGYING